MIHPKINAHTSHKENGLKVTDLKLCPLGVLWSVDEPQCYMVIAVILSGFSISSVLNSYLPKHWFINLHICFYTPVFIKPFPILAEMTYKVTRATCKFLFTE